jgi:hypothetical protein
MFGEEYKCYLGTTLVNENCICEEIKSNYIPGMLTECSSKSFVFPLSKNLKIKIDFAHGLVR